MPATDLGELAAELLNQSAAALGALAPARRVLVVGDPALDCRDQLAVGVVPPGVHKGDVGAPQGGLSPGVECITVTLVGLRVTLTGCVPPPRSDGTPPSPTEINTASDGLYRQGWTLWCGLRARVKAGTVFGEQQPKRYIDLGPLLPVPDQGGTAGWTVDVVVGLDPDPNLGA